MTLFLRLLDVPVEAKAVALQKAASGGAINVFVVDPRNFSKVPGSPFAYWVSDRLRQLFESARPFEIEGRCAKGGMKTQADERFLRLYWETNETSDSWVPLCKGGQFARFYSDVHLVTDWWMGGKRPRAAYEQKAAGETWGGFGRNESFYLRPGLTWPRRTNGLSFRVMPSGCIFADKGPAVFVETDGSDLLLALCALMNSKPFAYLVSVQLARTELAQSFEVGLIQQTPVPDLSPQVRVIIANLARRAWSLKRTLDTANETSHAFLLPQSLLRRTVSFDTKLLHAELDRIQFEIDDIAFHAYALDGEDRALIEEWGRGRPTQNATEESTDSEVSEDEDGAAETANDAEALLSWSVGVAFGRFDIRLATRERPIPPEPQPFDPLPAKSLGMLPNSDAPFKQCSGVLVDDQGHESDFVAHVAAVYDHVGEPAPEPDVLRRTLARDFFPAHIKMYSKSRRKAPIYWQLATPSASYSVWLYVHAFTKDTLLRVQNDYVVPKLAHEQRQLEALRVEAGQNPSGPQNKSIAAMESFVEELQAFLEVVKRVAQLWNPNLDDGVIVNFAPLWRLVTQHKSWQNELKTTWNALCAGTYDWTHLAMHLWPERVVPKCADDRSLAIAHGLEDVFWFEDEDGKWKPYKEPQKPIANLVRERTSAAVKAALKNLIDAPELASGAKRSRKPKAA